MSSDSQSDASAANGVADSNFPVASDLQPAFQQHNLFVQMPAKGQNGNFSQSGSSPPAGFGQFSTEQQQDLTSNGERGQGTKRSRSDESSPTENAAKR